MNKYTKQFLLRGLMFGGFGPIIMSIIYFILEKMVEGFSLSGSEVLMATVSVYILAFLHAGTSVFNQIEGWSILKSLVCHFSVLYVAYAAFYFLNSFIPFNINFFLIFTAIFITIYLVIWLIVFIAIKLTSKKLNEKIR